MGLMNAQDFISWALDPKRTDEEAFFAELLTERGFEAWCSKNIKGWYLDWRDDQEKHRRRRLNPAHRAELEPRDVERAAQMLPTITYLRLGNSYDRPLRDLSGLQFVPHLKHLQVEHSEIPDFSPVSGLVNLEQLQIWDDVVEDLRPLAQLTKLKQLWVNVAQPWPLVDGWNALTELELLSWRGNLFVIQGLGPFPKLNWAILHASASQTPLRNVTTLPELPVVRRLDLNGIHRLEGIERYAGLQFLKLEGAFPDLTPLTSLTTLTHLDLRSNAILNLGVLCRLPELRSLKLQSYQPQEWFVLTEAPKLHEVETVWCEANVQEVATLQEVLPAWDEDFRLPEPRPLPEPAFVALEPQQWQQQANPRSEENWDGNYEMQCSERGWLERQMQAALDRLFGPGWGVACYHQVQVHKLEAAERLPEIVAVVRQVLAACRHPHMQFIRIELKAPALPKQPRPAETEEHRLKREFAEHRAHERQWAEEARLRERQHRWRQLQQEGVKVNPEEFAPEPEPLVVEELDADNEVDDEEGEPHLLAEQYDLYLDVTEPKLVVHMRSVEVAERLLGRKARRL